MSYINYENGYSLFRSVGNAIKGQEGLLSDTVGWTGKNRLQNTLVTGSQNNVTFTRNDADASVTINTSAAASAATYRRISTFKPSETIIGIFSATEETLTNMSIQIYDNTASSVVKNYAGGGDSDVVTLPSGHEIVVQFIVNNGATVSNKTFYPMLRDARISDSTYEPYHEPVDVCKYNIASAIRNGAHNLAKPSSVASSTDNGVAYTNADGIVTANNQATADSKFSWDIGHLPVGKYRITGCPSGGSASKYCIRIGVDTTASGWGSYVQADYGDGAEFEVDDATKFYSIACRVFNGFTASSLVFKPMITDINDTDSTYTPHAMTNRELTTGLTNAARAISFLGYPSAYRSTDGSASSVSVNLSRLKNNISGFTYLVLAYQYSYNTPSKFVISTIGSNDSATTFKDIIASSDNDIILSKTVSNNVVQITASRSGNSYMNLLVWALPVAVGAYGHDWT